VAESGAERVTQFLRCRWRKSVTPKSARHRRCQLCVLWGSTAAAATAARRNIGTAAPTPPAPRSHLRCVVNCRLTRSRASSSRVVDDPLLTHGAPPSSFQSRSPPRPEAVYDRGCLLTRVGGATSPRRWQLSCPVAVVSDVESPSGPQPASISGVGAACWRLRRGSAREKATIPSPRTRRRIRYALRRPIQVSSTIPVRGVFAKQRRMNPW
jgi:hypothetical protein